MLIKLEVAGSSFQFHVRVVCREPTSRIVPPKAAAMPSGNAGPIPSEARNGRMRWEGCSLRFPSPAPYKNSAVVLAAVFVLLIFYKNKICDINKGGSPSSICFSQIVMTKQNEKLLVTTAIDYVNAPPHLGHCLEKIQADVMARYHRLLDEDVFFLTGTDENSLKNVQAAEKAAKPVKEFVDTMADRFFQLKSILNLSFDDFVRTTEERHIKGAQKLWQACQKDIYKKEYKGLYCVGCEEFYKREELEGGCCPEHKKECELIEEENYFFRLSKYQGRIKRIIKNNKVTIIPESRKNEILSFINQGLQDICISRSNERARGWGIDVPGDPSQKMWCWIEALANYITALGYEENGKKFQDWWQNNENKIHIIGKGISRFHCVYWLGILLSAELALPKTIFVHGYITVGGQKMSKSLGNVIDPFELVDKYGADAVRYFLLREIPSTEDGDFTYEKFEQRYNADLASGLGNLAARVMTMAKKAIFNFQFSIFNKFSNSNFQTFINKTWQKYRTALDDFKFNEALAAVWELISFCDTYIDKERPWENKNQKLKSKNQKVISDLLFILKEITRMLKPFLPATSEKILAQIKSGKKGKPLFPRLAP
jgi:methionyl-tRNA synthetase